MMAWLKSIGAELIGLFVDDFGFAVAILTWLLVVALGLPALGLSGTLSALLLFAGLIAILAESAMRRARRR